MKHMKYVILGAFLIISLSVKASEMDCTTICTPDGTFCTMTCDKENLK